MTTPINIQGKHFTVEGNKLNIGPGLCFGYKTQDGNWAIWHPNMDLLGLGFPQEMDPSPVAHRIVKIIQNDAAAGRDHLIAYVGLNPLATLQLWLEGVLTRTHVENCRESEDEAGAYIEFENVMLGGKPRTVRAYQTPQYNMATYDTQGEVV
jgi:hypothetical protein